MFCSTVGNVCWALEEHGMTISRNIDEARLSEFSGKVMAEGGEALSIIVVMGGGKPGLYRSMHLYRAPIAPPELAHRTNTPECCVR